MGELQLHYLADSYPVPQNLDADIDSNGLFTHFRQVSYSRSHRLPIGL